MPSAKLIKTLEKEGFELEFPEYSSNEEIIIDILKEGDARIGKSLPLFLRYDFDYGKIAGKLNRTEKKELDRAIFISRKIYQKEKIESRISEIIKENGVESKFSEKEFLDYYETFKESRIMAGKGEQKVIERQSKLRINLDLNKSLAVLFSPAKIRIMGKIFNHEKLSNTELKYYYRAISNIDKAVLNPAVQDYLRVIEISRKMN